MQYIHAGYIYTILLPRAPILQMLQPLRGTSAFPLVCCWPTVLFTAGFSFCFSGRASICPLLGLRIFFQFPGFTPSGRRGKTRSLVEGTPFAFASWLLKLPPLRNGETWPACLACGTKPPLNFPFYRRGTRELRTRNLRSIPLWPLSHVPLESSQ